MNTTHRAPGLKRRLRTAAAALFAFSLIAASCAGGDTAAEPPTVTEETSPVTSGTPTTTEAATRDTAPADTTDITVETTDTTTEPVAEESATDTTHAEVPEEDAETDDSTPDETGEVDTAVAGEVVDDDAADDSEDTDETATEEADETADETETIEATYERRSPDSVFPDRAYFDHDAIRVLFPECAPPPQIPQWMVYHFERWDSIYAGWDTDSQRLSGLQIASGWWTDEQLSVWLPDSGINAASARRDGTYSRELDTVLLWPAGPAPESKVEGYYYPYKFADGDVELPSLYARAESRGYVDTHEQNSTTEELLLNIRDDGMPGNTPNPPNLNIGFLLWEWAIFRAQEPPTIGEPAAYAVRTLLQARTPDCVVEHMLALCSSGDTPTSPLLYRSDRFGRVLWSLICPEGPSS